jgi:thioredoxin-related protein
MVTNFSQRSIVEKTRQHFVALAVNMWGDRDVTWLDGRVMTEKELARVLKVQFTPTLLFFNEKGKVVTRLNGYYPPQRFEPVLDYVAGHLERRQALGDYLNQRVREPASPVLHDETFFLGPSYDLRRKPGAKPLAVLFETTHCSPCDELHDDGLQRAELRALVSEFDVARFSLAASTRPPPLAAAPPLLRRGRASSASRTPRRSSCSIAAAWKYFGSMRICGRILPIAALS